jgi:hypothetical protein|tara:strand:- start:826 stop:1017 length:192 start_codon:yes stop_codon:yes gene_type:complete
MDYRGARMDPRLTSIKKLIRDLNKEIDDILWEETSDPRIEALVEELEYLKLKESKGELYEPKF